MKLPLIVMMCLMCFLLGTTLQTGITRDDAKRGSMVRVTGLGGIFFKCRNPEEMKSWYQKHLGIQSDQYGTRFEWRYTDQTDKKGYTVWSPFSDDTDYFNPSTKQFMINYRVENLKELINILRREGVQVVGEIEEYDYGKFGWILDPEGNKVELWEPVEEKSK